MTRRAYVAGKYEDKERVRAVQRLLAGAGYTITYDWTTNEQVSPEQAQHDLDGVITADLVVVVAQEDLAYKGTLVELGAALALGKEVVVLGPALDNCIFLQLPQIRRDLSYLV